MGTLEKPARHPFKGVIRPHACRLGPVRGNLIRTVPDLDAAAVIHQELACVFGISDAMAPRSQTARRNFVSHAPLGAVEDPRPDIRSAVGIVPGVARIVITTSLFRVARIAAHGKEIDLLSAGVSSNQNVAIGQTTHISLGIADIQLDEHRTVLRGECGFVLVPSTVVFAATGVARRVHFPRRLAATEHVQNCPVELV